MAIGRPDFSPIGAIQKITPLHNQAFTSGNDLLGSVLTPVYAPSVFRLQVCIDAANLLYVRLTRGGNTQVLDPFVRMGANIMYTFDLLVDAGDTVNFRFALSCTVKSFKVIEIQPEFAKFPPIGGQSIIDWGGVNLDPRNISADLQVLTDLVKAGDNADGVAEGSANILETLSRRYSYNGATWDRSRGNQEIQLLASATRAAAVDSAILTNYDKSHLTILFKVTARTVGATPLLRLDLVWYHPNGTSSVFTTGNFDPVVDEFFLIFGPGVASIVTGTFNRVVKMLIPWPAPRRLYLAPVYIQDITDLTYSIGAILS
ncbi:MAG: hypothetical protein HY673_12990 [Chloroflexi bacterium]|nr:hypothetical protein [Chloroflexota bacterium]